MMSIALTPEINLFLKLMKLKCFLSVSSIANAKIRKHYQGKFSIEKKTNLVPPPSLKPLSIFFKYELTSLFKAGRILIFPLFQLTNQTKVIFHLQFPSFKVPRLLTAGDPLKISLFELDSKVALTRFHLFNGVLCVILCGKEILLSLIMVA